MADDVDQGLVEFLEHEADGIQRVIELRLHVRLVGIEGDVRWHVEHNRVAHAGDRDAGILQALTQLGFLVVHVNANTATGECADACTDQCGFAGFDGVVAPISAPAAPPTSSARASAEQALRDLLFTGVWIGGAGGEQRMQKQRLQESVCSCRFPSGIGPVFDCSLWRHFG